MIPENPYEDLDIVKIFNTLTFLNPDEVWQRCANDYKEYLFSPCTEHHITWIELDVGKKTIEHFEHRYQCPECMAELKEG